MKCEEDLFQIFIEEAKREKLGVDELLRQKPILSSLLLMIMIL